MAVVVPVIASFAAASAATTTIGMFLTYSAAAMTTLGAISGDKDLMKIGGIMGLAGGAWGAVASSGASAAGEAAASSAWDAAGSAAGSDAAQFAKYAQPAAETTAEAAGGAFAQEAGTSMASDVAKSMANEAGAEIVAEATGEVASEGARSLMDSASPAWDSAGSAAGSDAAQFSKYAEGNSLMSSNSGSGITVGSNQGASLYGNAQAPSSAQIGSNVSPSIQDAASKMGQDRMGNLLTSAEKWARQHKTILDLGGKIVAGVTDPNAKLADAQMDTMRRRQNNLNSPVRLGIVKGS